MRIDNNGNVGIGTTSPLGSLDVTGSLMYVRDSGGNGTLRFTNYNGINYIQSGVNTNTGSSANLNFTSMNNANNWMTITSTGNVGVGTTSPVANLHVGAGAPGLGADLSSKSAFIKGNLEVDGRSTATGPS